jgi:hypothetical protein
MSNSRSAILGLCGLAIALLLSVGCAPVSSAAAPPTPLTDAAEIAVALSAANTTTSWDERDADRVKFDLPLLYLHHQREATEATERTLEVRIVGLAGATEIQIEAQSLHADVTTGEHHRAVATFRTPERPCTTQDPCTLGWTFDTHTLLSDLYTLRVTDTAGNLLWENPTPERPAFVALDTWEVQPDPAYTVRVYYATLFPFAAGPQDLANRLPPAGVNDFIAGPFSRLIVDTWHTQVQAWGFGPLHEEWDTDHVMEIFMTAPPFALFDGTGTYTAMFFPDGRPYPERRIWWFASHEGYQRYDTWQDAYRTVFAHEFFHLMQFNVLLSTGEADTGRPIDLWDSVLESQARFAAGAQHPELELHKQRAGESVSLYGKSANRFLAQRMNSSCRTFDAERSSEYEAVLYWRFLYEQYDDMGIIRAALEEMVRHHHPDILVTMEPALDAALARVPGPFESFKDSLVAFARATYALRLENGRCTAADLATCGALYFDPDRVYQDPPLEAQLRYDGSRLIDNLRTARAAAGDYGGYYGLDQANANPAPAAETDETEELAFRGAIPASYGMDFVELLLDPRVQGQPLVIRVQAEGTVARFQVQVWKLGPDPAGIKPRAAVAAPESASQADDGAQVYVIPNLDTTAYDRLALIITRLDADEMDDAIGSYQVTLEGS